MFGRRLINMTFVCTVGIRSYLIEQSVCSTVEQFLSNIYVTRIMLVVDPG